MPHLRLSPVLLAVLLACQTAPADPAPAPAPPPDALPSDQWGPYAVGATTIERVDPRGKWMVLEVWYPASPAPDAVLEGYAGLNLSADAFRDPPWDERGAPYPVVAFSHGYGGIRFQSSYLTTWLASHGFVVVAPDHEHNTLLDLNSQYTTQVAAERPADVAAAIDIADAVLPGRLDLTDGYAMVGHSFGAWTALVVGGGRVDKDALLAWCAVNDDPGCGFFDTADLQELEDLEQAAPDPRAAVAVALAPGLAYSFGADGLSDNVPTLVQGGDRDGDMPYEREIRPVYEALPASAALVTLHDAAHFGFSDLCSALPLGGECAGAEEGYMEIPRVHALSRTLTTAWIRARWRGETGEEVFLDPEQVEAGGDADWEP